MKNKKKQVATPVKKVEAFTNKNSLLCNICGIYIEECEDVCGNGHEVKKDSSFPNSAEKFRKEFFSNQL